MGRFAFLLSMGSVTLVTIGTLGCYLLAMLILGRSLSKESFGYVTLWVYALNVLGAASLLGFPNAILRHYPRARLTGAQWGRALPKLAFQSLVACSLGAWVFHLIYDLPQFETLLLFLAASTIGFTLLPITILQIFGRFALAQGLYTLWRVGMLVGIGACLALSLDLHVRQVFIAIALSGFLQALLSVASVLRHPQGTESLPLRPLLPDAGVFASLFVAAMLLLRLDAFFIPKLLNFEALGTYSALSFLALTGYGVISLAVGQVLNPKLANREPVPLKRLTLMLALGGLLIGSVLALTSTWTIPFLFGDKYEGDFRLVVGLLSLVGVLQVLYAIPSSKVGILGSKKLLRLYVPLSLSSLVVDALLLLWLVPKFGMRGAAGAAALTWFWRTGTAWLAARRLSPN